MEITQENISKLEEENLRLKKQLEEKDHNINSLCENYFSQKEIHDALWEPFWGDFQKQGKEIKRLKEKIFKLDEKVFLEEQKRSWCEMEIIRLKIQNTKLKQGQKNA